MRAITIHPKVPNSLAVSEVPDPERRSADLLCEMKAVGICGTDLELIAGDYGAAPPNSERLVIGHEALGRVLESNDSRFKKGDWIVPIVRRPDPVPCEACAAGEWDMCRNGLYTECGISKRNGFASERFVVESDFAILIDPTLGELGVLLEPCSIVVKAIEQSERLFSRSVFKPKRALVTGAGPVGLLAALTLKQKGFDVHVLDHATDGPKPELVQDLGATYHSDLESLRKTEGCFEFTIECTGAPDLVAELMTCIAPDGILCLTGVSHGGRKLGLDIGALNREIVLENEIIFGSVNANKRHYEGAQKVLAHANRKWLSRLITKRVPLVEGVSAYQKSPGDIKNILVAAN